MAYSHLLIPVLLLLILEGLTNAVPTAEHSHDIIGQAQAQTYLVDLNSTCDQQILPDENNYIVAFNKQNHLKEHLVQLNKFIAGHTTCIDCAIDNKVTRICDTMAVKYYFGIFDARVIEYIKSSRGVISLSLDREIEHFAVTVQKDATWSLARITVPGPFFIPGDRGGTMIDSQDFLYPYEESAGVDARIYIMDCGVRRTHAEFQEGGKSRVEPGVDIGDTNGSGDIDTVGHGTAVASIAAGRRLGVAKKATIIPVKLASKHKDIDLGRIYKGLDWVLADFINNKNSGPGIINISVFLPRDEKLDWMLEQAIKAGLHVVTTAGNANQNECANQPSDVGQLHIGATDQFDFRWSSERDDKGSNFGPCVTMYAPGAFITAAQSKDDEAQALISGTSLSTPLVAGIIATIASDEPKLTPAEMKLRVEGMGLRGRINGLETTDHDILLQSPVTSMPSSTEYLLDVTSWA